MELRHLRYFIAVADEGSFTAAAARLHTVQPSLSRQIRDLEEHVGTRLFERTSRRVALTPAGRVFLEEARLVLEQSERMLDRTRQAGRAQAGALSLGFIPGVEIEELSRVMDALSGGPDENEIVLRSLSSPMLIAGLHEQQLDAGFIRPSLQSQGLRMRTIRRERLVVALPADHPLAAQPSIAIGQLAGQRLIDVTARHAPVLFDVIQAYGAEHGVALTPAYQSENLMMALSLISTVGGICLLPELSARLFPAGVVAVPLAGDPPTIELALAWHPDNRSPALASFLRHFD